MTDDDADESGDPRIQALFAAARSMGTADEMAAGDSILLAMIDTTTHSDITTLAATRNQRRHRFTGSRTATRAAIVVAGVLVGTSAAAASGNLPDAAQSAVARATSHLGFDLPDPHDTEAHPASETSAPTAESVATTTLPPIPSDVTPPPSAQDQPSPPSMSGETPVVPPPTESQITSPSGPTPAPSDPAPSSAQGPSLDGPAKKALCTAWAAHDPDDSRSVASRSVAMNQLEAAAAAVGATVEQFCAPEPDTADAMDEPDPPDASSGSATAGPPGKPDDTPDKPDKPDKQPATPGPPGNAPTTTNHGNGSGHSSD